MPVEREASELTSERKDQSKLSQAEWGQLIDAIEQLHGVTAARPAYRDFVALHVDAMTTARGMIWEVHTMRNMGMVGRNFLAWHRRYILSFELRLQQVHPAVTLPYWDWLKSPSIPAALDDPATLQRLSVTRGQFDPSQMPTASLVNPVLGLSNFTAFQTSLEALHGSVHNAVGGDMGGPRSPNDPLFFLHHANIDRLWAKWEASPNASDPPNGGDSLKPKGKIISGKVRDVLAISALGYRYA